VFEVLSACNERMSITSLQSSAANARLEASMSDYCGYAPSLPAHVSRTSNNGCKNAAEKTISM
jgi:hypothetical protein